MTYIAPASATLHLVWARAARSLSRVHPQQSRDFFGRRDCWIMPPEIIPYNMPLIWCHHPQLGEEHFISYSLHLSSSYIPIYTNITWITWCIGCARARTCSPFRLWQGSPVVCFAVRWGPAWLWHAKSNANSWGRWALNSLKRVIMVISSRYKMHN